MEVYDYFENKLLVGDWVALSMDSSTSLTCGEIIKISVSEKGTINVGVEIETYIQRYRTTGKVVRYRRPYNVIKMDRELVIEKKIAEK